MAELTRERREEMRRRFAFLLEAPLIFETVTIPTAGLLALLDAADERDRLREALTPSAETKDAYIGEFVFHTSHVDEDGDDVLTEHTVPWTTIKEIMAAIRDYAKEVPPHAPL